MAPPRTTASNPGTKLRKAPVEAVASMAIQIWLVCGIWSQKCFFWMLSDNHWYQQKSARFGHGTYILCNQQIDGERSISIYGFLSSVNVRNVVLPTWCSSGSDFDDFQTQTKSLSPGCSLIKAPRASWRCSLACALSGVHRRQEKRQRTRQQEGIMGSWDVSWGANGETAAILI